MILKRKGGCKLEKKRVLYADLALLIVAIIWGSGFVIIKNTLDVVTPFYLNAYRFIIAGVLLAIILYKKLLKATKDDIKSGILIGVFLFLGFAVQTEGLQYTEASKQAFITSTYVVMVPFIYWMISKIKPNKFEVLAAFLCLIGIGILSLEKNLGLGYGETLTLISAVMFALHVSATGYFAIKSDPYVISVVQLLVTGILSLVCALIFEGTNISLDSSALFPILYLAVFSSMIAFLIQTVGQKYTSSTHTAIILSLEALFGSIFGVILLNDPVTLRFVIGASIILISVITSETKWKFLRKKQKDIK